MTSHPGIHLSTQIPITTPSRRDVLSPPSKCLQLTCVTDSVSKDQKGSLADSLFLKAMHTHTCS